MNWEAVAVGALIGLVVGIVVPVLIFWWWER